MCRKTDEFLKLMESIPQRPFDRLMLYSTNTEHSCLNDWSVHCYVVQYKCGYNLYRQKDRKIRVAHFQIVCLKMNSI